MPVFQVLVAEDCCGVDMVVGVAITAADAAEAQRIALTMEPFSGDEAESDLRIERLSDPELDAWADGRDAGESPPILLLRPHFWRYGDESECSCCGLYACGSEDFEVCGWCDTCRACSSEEQNPDDDEVCIECGRWS